MNASYEYDANFTPAAPVAIIGLGPSGEVQIRQQVTALLDSGADGTMIPVDWLLAAGARFVEQRRMWGVVGNAVIVNLYLTAVHIGGHIIHGVRAVGGLSGTEAIIGRDVLNQLEVTLNGPAQETWIA